MNKNLDTLKCTKQLVILSNGTCFIEYGNATKIKNHYNFYNQDLTNHPFWVENLKSKNVESGFDLLNFAKKFSQN